jgi:GTP-binding protein EngB required for normal cell division
MASTELTEILSVLRDLTGPASRGAVDDLVDRLASGTVRVLLVGEAKRGKSTVGNALVGRPVLPTGVTPVTSVSTTLQVGAPERIEVHFHDGHTELLGLENLAEYVTEQGNPANAKGVLSVDVVIDSGLPVPGMSIVDTPGTGSVFDHNTDEAAAARERMDLAVFVLTADPPLSASESALLDEVRREAVATFVVLNKIDRLRSDERTQALDFLRAVLPGIEVLPCSARDGFEARTAGDAARFDASGMRAVMDAITTRVSTRGREDLEASISAAAQRLVDSLADETDVTLSALDAADDAGRARVVAFRSSLEALPQNAGEARARVGWRLREQRRALAADAADRVGRLTHEARRAVAEVLDAPEAPRDAELLEDRAEARLRETVTRGLTSWREDWGSRLEAWLEGLATDEQEHLDTAVRSVREAAERELGLTLRLPPFVLELPKRSGFRFDFSDPVGWEAPLAGTVRRHAPSGIARRRLGKDLARRASDLPDRHLGRARHDLDQRLADTVRGFLATVLAAYGELGEGLTAALDAATRATTMTAPQLAAQREELEHRARRLASLSTALRSSAVSA